MRILLLSQWFDPEPTFKGLIFAQELVRRGHQVEVLTGFPNYPEGKLYPGYRLRLWQRECLDGISILRVPLYPSHTKSSLGRILNYLSFAISASIGCLFVRRPEVVYAYHPPATVALPALVASAVYRAPLVYDIQDLWPDTVAATGMVRSKWVLRLLSRWCRFVYDKADCLVVLSPGFKQVLSQRGVPENKIKVIYNWCDERVVAGDDEKKGAADRAGTFTVLFAGTMGLAQDLDAVLEAARICAASTPQVRFVFVGGGVDRERLIRKAREMRLINVQFLPRVQIHEVSRMLNSADVLLVHLKDDPLFRVTIPSKTQAYLATGKPILMAVKGDAEALIQRSGGGVVCEPGNPEEIARTARMLAHLGAERLAAMGQSGRSFYARELSMRAGVDHFEVAFQSVRSCLRRSNGLQS